MEFLNNSRETRFFLPVTGQAYDWFYAGKKWEIRNLKGRFNDKNLRIGRNIEIRKGYNGTKIYGKISDVKIFNSEEELFCEIDYLQILPCCTSLLEAKIFAKSFVSRPNKIIAIKIDAELSY